MDINERIRHLRKDILKLTQLEFSKELNISRSNMGNIEIGRIAVTNRVIIDICETYNINEEWLRTGQGEMYKKRLETDEVSEYVEELLEYDGEGNPFFDMIIEMMKTYKELDEKSQVVIRNYFGSIKESINKKKED